jgi:molybdopterin synthase catalytic subunit
VEINVLFFAVFRERLGKSEQVLELPEDATLSTAVATLEREHPVIAELRGRYRIAVNQEMVDGDPTLRAGDEVVLIPPVAGGQRHVRVLAEPLSVDRVIAAVKTPGTGGLVTFTGMVRDHSKGRDVERLEYEAYEPMAVKVMTEVIEEIESEIAGIRLAVEHRVGKLAIGDLAVVIACAAAHRDEAFRGCRAMIDRLKDRAPIWKKEIGPDGDEWVGLGP